MKKILIATTNKDKFEIVKYLLKKAGLTEDGYEIISLYDIHYSGPDNKEIGNIEQRAKCKAETVRNFLKNEDYDYIIGIDDGIIIKGKMIENVKDYIKKILYEHYLCEDEKIIFSRAYCIIGKNNEIFEAIIDIPYIHISRENVCLKEFSYPLNQVLAPIGYDKPIAEMTVDESNRYFWKYSETKIKELVKPIISK